MPYEFQPGKIYRMPTHFGPAPGPRSIPASLRSDPAQSPRKTLVAASFYTDPEILDKHIPPRFSLWGDPIVTVEFHYMTNIDWLAGRGYTMVHVWWPAVFEGKSGRTTGRFLAAMWENLADPIITGRCEIGQPKLYADVPEVEVASGSYRCKASWMGFEFLSVEVHETGEVPGTAANLDGTLMLKYVPRTGDWGQADLCQVSFTPNGNANQTVEARRAGQGNIQFSRASWQDLPTMCHVVNALSDMPQLRPGPASVAVSRGGKPYLDQRILE